MRFIENGPDIPSELLEACDAGEVVFLCGAGISKGCGLPDFRRLAKHIVDDLGAPPEAESRQLLDAYGSASALDPRLDRVFTLIEREYGRSLLDEKIARRLRTPKNADVTNHSTILRLSTAADAHPQVVTTNFDRLFERAAKQLRYYAPPALPDIESGRGIQGLVYLHGRLAFRNAPQQQGLVITSADLGRAYLSQGWAARFLADLVRRQIVVLVGYKASDPPVEYLLEGLHSASPDSAGRIFAFDRGSEEELIERWRGRGVIPIRYVGEDHSDLWSSLSLWADRADDPDSWRSAVIDLARRGPRELEPYERGQVAELLLTEAGANAFCTADPPPPAEWCCVMDVAVRFGRPTRAFGDAASFDPWPCFHLDSDAPRPESSRDPIPAGAVDLLSIQPSDGLADVPMRLGGVPHRWLLRLPPRLHSLAHWLMRVADDPVSLWWAAGRGPLHPHILDLLDNRRHELEEPARTYWSLVVEAGRDGQVDEAEIRWHHFRRTLNRSGWTVEVVRSLQRVVSPYLDITRPLLRERQPPVGSWSGLDPGRVLRIEVEFPGHDLEISEIPKAHVANVLGVVRAALVEAASLLADAGDCELRTADFVPDDLPGQQVETSIDKFLAWFRRLFEQLVKEDPGVARAEMQAWPANCPYFFDKLRLWAWLTCQEFAGSEVGEGIRAVSHETFWRRDHSRLLLHVLRSRWQDLPAEITDAIEQRIADGPQRWPDEDSNDYEQRRARSNAMVLGWLNVNGCALSSDGLAALVSARASLPDWNIEWELSADQASGPRSGWLDRDTDSSVLESAPVERVVELAEQLSGPRPSEHLVVRPFEGLVSRNVAKAVAALESEALKERYNSELWQCALRNWPEDTDDGMTRTFASMLSQAPLETFYDMRFDIGAWARDFLPAIASEDLDAAYSLWNQLVDRLLELDEGATLSSIREATMGGVVVDSSRRTFTYAMGSPAGAFGEAAVCITKSARREPPNVRRVLDSFERLLSLPGEGGDHAACMMARYLHWLFDGDPDRSMQIARPMLRVSHARAESCWDGLLHSDRLPEPKLFREIKSDFESLVMGDRGWELGYDAHRLLHKLLLVACQRGIRDKHYPSIGATRTMLQRTDDRGRAQVLHSLRSLLSKGEGWTSFGRPFLQKAWPLETRFQTAATSRILLAITSDNKKNFEEIARVVMPLLRPIENLDVLLHPLSRDGEGTSGLCETFPAVTLELLDRVVPANPRIGPYGLQEVLEAIEVSDPGLRTDASMRRLRRVCR